MYKSIVNKSFIAGIELFIVLQILDMATTLIFLSLGLAEANPIVLFAIKHTTPFVGVLVMKCILLAIVVAYRNWTATTVRSLVRANFLYMLVVFWNGFVITLHLC